MKTLLAAAVSGALFGAGLVVSRMSDPNKVLAFLDVLGEWDPSLAVVMLAAVGTTTVGFRLAWGRGQPLVDSRFHLPTRRDIDKPLVLGAALFGLGWGLAGYCPGPALTALAVAPAEGLWFVGAMVAGMALRWALASRSRQG